MLNSLGNCVGIAAFRSCSLLPSPDFLSSERESEVSHDCPRKGYGDLQILQDTSAISRHNASARMLSS